MRLQLTVQRQSLPPVRVLWTPGATRPTSNAAGASYTISQFLEQVNEIIPLEADDWGLEDYAVEVGGFECLHFSELNQILKEDDEVWYAATTASPYALEQMLISRKYTPIADVRLEISTDFWKASN